MRQNLEFEFDFYIFNSKANLSNNPALIHHCFYGLVNFVWYKTLDNM